MIRIVLAMTPAKKGMLAPTGRFRFVKTQTGSYTVKAGRDKIIWLTLSSSIKCGRLYFNE